MKFPGNFINYLRFNNNLTKDDRLESLQRTRLLDGLLAAAAAPRGPGPEVLHYSVRSVCDELGSIRSQFQHGNPSTLSHRSTGKNPLSYRLS